MRRLALRGERKRCAVSISPASSDAGISATSRAPLRRTITVSCCSTTWSSTVAKFSRRLLYVVSLGMDSSFPLYRIPVRFRHEICSLDQSDPWPLRSPAPCRLLGIYLANALIPFYEWGQTGSWAASRQVDGKRHVVEVASAIPAPAGSRALFQSSSRVRSPARHPRFVRVDSLRAGRATSERRRYTSGRPDTMTGRR